MKSSITLISLILCMVFFSCSGHKKHINQDDQPLEHGKIITKVKCKKNLMHSYALYLPSNFSEEKKYPLIICFDPQGSGTKPLELLKDDAEKLGYILAGSNVSKNGMQWDATSEHYDILLTDLTERFNIDSTRIYTCGFSGGSRVASTVAIVKGGIASVIGCSAGFPQLKESIKTKFDYIGFAGSDDMNYAEMVTLNRSLDNNNIRHQLVIFDGTHAWPTKEVLGEAFLWIELNAMKDKKKAIDNNYINQKLSGFKTQLENFQKKGNKYEEYLLIKKIVNYFSSLADVKNYEDQLKLLEASPAVKSGISQAELNMKKELAMQQNYGLKLSSENAVWWKNEIAKLDNFITISRNEDEKHIVKRVLEYLSLSSFSASSSLYGQNRFAEAEHYIGLYAIIDKDNPEPEFMYAQIYARKKDADKTMEHLKKAADLGFSEKSRIDNDSIFQKFNADKRFAEIIGIIEKNKKQ
jgi:dienelactone hydrolase